MTGRQALEVVAGGGIEPNLQFTLNFQSPRQNASCRTYAANPCKIAGFDAFVKLLTTPSKL
jgi:hypothetical protein